MESFLKARIAAGDLDGAVVGIARRDAVVYLKGVGWADPARARPMPVDAVFDLSRLTQPVVAVAALGLLERGDWLLDDPLGRWLPPFADSRIELLDLLRQTSGLTPSLRVSEPGGGSRTVARSIDAATSLTGERFARLLAEARPSRPAGQVASFDFSYDVLGLAIERAAGETLGAVLLREIFIPLGLWQTGFNVSRERQAQAVHPPARGAGEPVRDLARRVSFECGGACLTSTAGDYLRFARMLLDGGRLDGKRVLARPTIDFMTSDRLGPDTDNRIEAPARPDGRADSGFGYGLGVVVRGAVADPTLPGSVGEFGLASPTGPFFWVDPAQRLAVVVMMLAPDQQQRLRLQRQVRALVLQAIDD